MMEFNLLGHTNWYWYTRDCSYLALHLQGEMPIHLEQVVDLGQLPDKVPVCHPLERWG